MNDTNTKPPAAGEAAHTPLPWAVSSSTVLVSTSDKRDIPVIGNLMDLFGVSSIGFLEARANAAFIVRACNAYEANQRTIAELTEALERIASYDAPDAHAMLQQARAALARAKELKP